MVVMPSPIIYCETCPPNISSILLLYDVYFLLIIDSDSIVTEVNLLQFLKALFPMLVTLLGIVIEVRLVIPAQMDAGITSTSFPKVNDVT